MAPQTYLFTRPEIEEAFGIEEAVAAVEDAFRTYGEGRVQMPPKVYLTFEKGDLRCMPVYMPTLGAAGVKNVNVHPANDDLPTVMATITLIDPDTGFPMALMDGTYLTSLRTGAAGGVAARHLAREDARVAAFVGAGRQAETQLAALLVTRPDIKRVLACDKGPGRAEEFCRLCRERHGIEAQAADPAEVVRSADILTTVTPVRKPIVRDEWVRPGTHINAIGADAPGKQELETAVLRRARIIIDNWDQASHSGEINVPLGEGAISREDLAGDIGELLTGRCEGRRSEGEVTVFDSTGLAIQDVSCAHGAYRKLTGSNANPRTIQFL
jgi:alanine dehydrogenase